jgi:hypothetical protein
MQALTANKMSATLPARLNINNKHGAEVSISAIKLPFVTSVKWYELKSEPLDFHEQRENISGAVIDDKSCGCAPTVA